MSTLSTHMQLILPDDIDPITNEDFNANMTAIDLKARTIECTSATLPSSPFAGQLIYETDTGKIRLRNAANSSWLTIGSVVINCTAATRPSTPFARQMIYETDTGYLCVRNDANSLWVVVAAYRGINNTADMNVTVVDGDMVWVRAQNAFYYRKNSAWNQLAGAYNRVAGAGTTGSGSYTGTQSGSTAAGISFVAPPSGRVNILFAAAAYNSGANENKSAVRVGTGATPGAGTETYAAVDDDMYLSSGTVAARGSSFARVSGLTGGVTYNAQVQHKVSAGTGTFLYKSIEVIPDL